MAKPPIQVLHWEGTVLHLPPRAPHVEGRGWRAVLAYYLRDGWFRHPMLDALHANAGYPDEAALRRLLSRGANPNLRLIIGQWPHPTLLGWGIKTGSLELVETLLAHKADPNLPGGDWAEAPLAQAVRMKHAKICQALLKAGASWESYGRQAKDSSVWVTAGWWAEDNGLLREPWARADYLGKHLEKTLEPVAPAPVAKRPRL